MSAPDRSQLPDDPLIGAADDLLYPEGGPQVFVGHYKMQGAPGVEAGSAICLDSPSRPCLYQCRGETRLKPENLLELY